MTGTAETEANEFHDIYKLDVVVIPTNRPIARVDLDDTIYKTRREKYNAIIMEIKAAHAQGQPILVGTISVESSELLSRMLKREGIIHNVLNAKFVQQEAEIVAGAGRAAPSPSPPTWPAAAPTSNSAPASTRSRASTSPMPNNASSKPSRPKRPSTRPPRARHQRPLRHRHRAPRIAPHRPPAPRPLRPPGRPGLLEVLRLVRGRPHAQLRRLPQTQQHDDPARHEGRRGTPASLAQQKRRIGPAPRRGTQFTSRANTPSSTTTS